jgi:hypothetical protein
VSRAAHDPVTSRRRWLGDAGRSAAGLWLAGGLANARGDDHPRSSPPDPRRGAERKKVAAVVTAYYPMSHAYHIVGRFLWGYQWRGVHHRPEFEVASLYTDQVRGNDVGQGLARRFGVRVSRDVADAITLGTGGLAVDAVLLIGEHGDYPNNAKGQKLYPRFELFQQVAAVIEPEKRGVPIFVDKHLSYDTAKALKMVAEAKRLNCPLMAGSSLPVTWRHPELELPVGVKLDEALVAGYGPDEIYGFHALETLQCMVERRDGGESGVKAVTALRGPAVWEAGDRKLWSWDLLEHALGRSETLNPGDIRANVAEPFAILVEYRDGLKTAALLLNGQIADFNFAGRLAGGGGVESCMFYLPNPPAANFFTPLTHHIETFFATSTPPYPIDRTLLTTGIIDAAMASAADRGRRVDTPALAIAYRPPDSSGFARGTPASPVPEPARRPA